MLPSSLRITGTAFRQALRTSLPLAAGATPGAGARGHYATNMQPSAASHPSATTPGPPTRPLQEFFSAARQAVREGKVNEHNPETVARLAALMGAISVEELGLDPDVVSDPFLGALKLHLRDSRIKYMRIYEDNSLTFGLFCFPAGATIPLHNHPGMTVFSRLVFGRLRVTAYDWVVPPPAPVTYGSRPARLVCDAVLGPSSAPVVLFPASGGNLHEFVAETPCAVLDLLTPPYEPPERNCTYYRRHMPPMGWPVVGARRHVGPAAPVLGEEVELEVFDPPDSFEVISGLYPGDPVT